MEALARLLREESALLLGRDPLKLEQVLEAKALRVSELASLDAQRERDFKALGLDAPSEETARALEAACPGQHLGELWNRLTTLAHECRRLNRFNGATAKLGQEQLSRALSILRGEDARATGLYQRDGSRDETAGGRLLGQA